jgi:hypothetical protein
VSSPHSQGPRRSLQATGTGVLTRSGASSNHSTKRECHARGLPPARRSLRRAAQAAQMGTPWFRAATCLCRRRRRSWRRPAARCGAVQGFLAAGHECMVMGWTEPRCASNACLAARRRGTTCAPGWAALTGSSRGRLGGWCFSQLAVRRVVDQVVRSIWENSQDSSTISLIGAGSDDSGADAEAAEPVALDSVLLPRPPRAGLDLRGAAPGMLQPVPR